MTDLRFYWLRSVRALQTWWAKSLALVLIAVVSFLFGMLWENKQITEDCRFMGVFRDGPQAYNCQVRIR